METRIVNFFSTVAPTMVQPYRVPALHLYHVWSVRSAVLVLALTPHPGLSPVDSLLKMVPHYVVYIL